MSEFSIEIPWLRAPNTAFIYFDTCEPASATPRGRNARRPGGRRRRATRARRGTGMRSTARRQCFHDVVPDRARPIGQLSPFDGGDVPASALYRWSCQPTRDPHALDLLMSTQRTPILQLVEDDDTLDDRRRRGEIACAECRRLVARLSALCT
jgi:hypothetical protein